jgi:hypothetical protein
VTRARSSDRRHGLNKKSPPRMSGARRSQAASPLGDQGRSSAHEASTVGAQPFVERIGHDLTFGRRALSLEGKREPPRDIADFVTRARVARTCPNQIGREAARYAALESIYNEGMTADSISVISPRG